MTSLPCGNTISPKSDKGEERKEEQELRLMGEEKKEKTSKKIDLEPWRNISTDSGVVGGERRRRVDTKKSFRTEPTARKGKPFCSVFTGGRDRDPSHSVLIPPCSPNLL